MIRLPLQPGRRMLDGTAAVFGAEALLLPTGLLIVSILTRRLGPEGYGVFALAATLVAWIEWSITAALARPTIKFIGEAEAWRDVATAVLWLHVAASGIAAGALWLVAPPLATLLREPALSGYLRLFALDIPVFALAHAHRHILVGLGGFRARALGSAARWLTRLLLVAVLVQMGLAITGAILGSIGGSVAELAVTRFYVRPRFVWRPVFPMRPILNYAVPLLLAGISMRLFDRLDLYALKILGGTTAQVGFYAAAQNLTLLTGILALAFTPILLATLSQAIAAANTALARTTAREAMRIVIGLLPVSGMAAGAAPGIVGVVFGQEFLPAAPLFAVLAFGAQALLMVAVTTTILTAAGRPGLTSVLTAPVPALAAGGYLWLIPRLGTVGAAIITTSCATLLAGTTIVAVYRVWRILPPLHTVWRSAATCVLAYGLAVIWATPGWLVLVKLLAITLLIAATYASLGEFRQTVPSPAS